MDVQDAKKRLDYGNKRYVKGEMMVTSPTMPLRARLAANGQKPYAAILSCCDSRIIPEAVFSATAGELYVVRTGGIVASDDAIGSLQYAVEALGVEYVLVLGHTDCAAVKLALEGKTLTGKSAGIVDTVRLAVKDCTSIESAVNVNTRFSAIMVRNALAGLKVTVEPAVFDMATGAVTYI